MSDEASLYPELAAHGGMVGAVQHALRSIGSPLPVTGGGWARVEQSDRFSQVSCGLNERRFSCDFWDRGVHLGGGTNPDLVPLAKSIQTWIEGRVKMSEMLVAFPFVSQTEIAEAFERDMEIEWQWDRVEERSRKDFHSDLHPLILEARKRVELNGLFPFTSLWAFCLSRCTGFPFTWDCPIVLPAKGGRFDVYSPETDVWSPERKLLGSGDAREAVQLIIDHLPPGTGRARKGTAEDTD